MLEPVVEQLLGLVGATVSRATAARLLGVSQPALDRWIDLREIATVLTPTGRRAVPTEQLVELLDDIRQARAKGHQRGLKSVVEERRCRAAALEVHGLLTEDELASIDDQGHRRGELASLAYHRAVARDLDDRSVRMARRRLLRWAAAGTIPDQRVAAWQSLLDDSSRAALLSILTSDSQESRDLRQSTPFAAALSEQQRRRILELTRRREPATSAPA